MENNKRTMRISLSIDKETYKAIHNLSVKKGIPKSTVIYSIIFQNKDIKRELNRMKNESIADQFIE
jgi:hypothetical protein